MNQAPLDNGQRPEPSDDSIQQVHSDLLNKKAEPSEGFSPMPLLILGFVSAMIFISAIYLVRSVHSPKGFDPLVYDERFDASKATGDTKVAAVDPIVLGKKLYVTCSQCHQVTGQGVAGAFPPLAGSEWVLGSEDRVIRILLHGLNGEVKVKGASFNGVMPAFGPGGGYNYSDEKIAAVLTYIRQEWGNTAPAITKEKVAEVRTKAVADRKNPWTQAELEAVP